jgi:hypothetical protein
MFHFARWQLFGDVYDMLAWKGLVGMIDKEETIRLVQSENGKREAERRKQEDPNWHKDFAAKGTQRAAELWNDPEWSEKRRQQNKVAGVLGGKKNKGKHWFHNPELKRETSSFDLPGEGWKPGRLPGQKRRRKK